MAEFMSYDPWKNITSRNGIPGDELVSALQKSIRRGKEEIAVDVAYEMYITSEQFEDKMWRRLMAMKVAIPSGRLCSKMASIETSPR